MNDNVQKYFSTLKQTVYEQISADINEGTIDEIVKTDLAKSHIDDKASAAFQEFYFLTLDNEPLYYSSRDFFRQFKKRYSLQGIDNNYLDKLERLKKEILENIRADKLAQLYFDSFNKAVIKHGNDYKEKDLGSFFAKLVHTFRPDEYCALDNPIKNYFGLKKESFFISFFIISVEYKHWATTNRKLIESIRDKFKQADKNGVLQHDKLTDLKLLDLIFWSKANRQ
ncbi:MAG: hypothetical protein BGO33_10775 [Bacteroidia bacterium 43-41]|nr:MAG: hypothetical protein BGO33_10775 [Bacteroidia bacterium 43-41]